MAKFEKKSNGQPGKLIIWVILRTDRQKGQDLCESASPEEHIFNTRCEHQTVHL